MCLESGRECRTPPGRSRPTGPRPGSAGCRSRTGCRRCSAGRPARSRRRSRPGPTSRPRWTGSTEPPPPGLRPAQATRRSTRRAVPRAMPRAHPAPLRPSARAPGSGGRRRPPTAMPFCLVEAPFSAAAEESALFACDVVPSSPELPTLTGEAVFARAASATARRVLRRTAGGLGALRSRPGRCRTSARAPGCRCHCSRSRRPPSGLRSGTFRPGCPPRRSSRPRWTARPSRRCRCCQRGPARRRSTRRCCAAADAASAPCAVDASCDAIWIALPVPADCDPCCEVACTVHRGCTRAGSVLLPGRATVSAAADADG